MRTIFIVAFIAVGVLILAPATASAQFGCGDCTERWITWPMKEHKIPDSEDASHECGDGVGCHSDYQDGSCIVYKHNHGTCGLDFAMELEG